MQDEEDARGIRADDTNADAAADDGADDNKDDGNDRLEAVRKGM